MIPKKIHYCWYGRGPKPAVFEKCLASWKKYMPDYEIIEWNEDNTNLSYCAFLKDAYDNQKWAFVSDVVRCLVVYENGGIYMDTDVEITDRAFAECFQNDDAVFFFESRIALNTGIGFGAISGHPLLGAILKDYKASAFDPNRLGDMSCPRKNTDVIKKTLPEFKVNGKTQRIGETSFICVGDYWKTAHHYGEMSWMDEEHKRLAKYVKRMNVPQKVRDKLWSPKIYGFFDTFKLKPARKLYTFLVYDFIDYGPRYFFARIWQKVMRTFDSDKK